WRNRTAAFSAAGTAREPKQVRGSVQSPIGGPGRKNSKKLTDPPRDLSLVETEQKRRLYLGTIFVLARQRGLRDSFGVLEAFLLRHRKVVSMQLLAFSYPTLAVSAIYCIWSAYHRVHRQRQRLLRERVAYMLWV